MPNSIRIQYELWVNWAGDRVVKPSELIRGDLRKIVCTLGRENRDTLKGRSTGGQCEVLLRNIKGDYSMFNVRSPYFGKVLPGRAIQVRAYVGSRMHVLWTGFLKDILPHLGTEESGYADLTAVGSLTWIDQARYELFFNLDNIEQIAPRILSRVNEYNGADLIALVLNLIGWSGHDIPGSPALVVPGPFGRRLEVGIATFDGQALATDESVSGSGTGSRVRAIRTIRAIENLELGFVRESKLADIVFENRYSRLFERTFGPLFTDRQDSSAFPYDPLDLSSYDDNIYNVISSDQVKYYYHPESQIRDVIPGLEDEKGAEDPILVPANSAVEYVVTLLPSRYGGVETGAPAYVWPWKNIVVAPEPVNNNDPRLNETLAWDLSASFSESSHYGEASEHISVVTLQGARSVHLTITNSHKTRDVYIVRLRLRGFAHYPKASIRAQATNEMSVAKYGVREYQIPTSISFIRGISSSNRAAIQYVKALADIYGEPRPNGTLFINPRYSEQMANTVLDLDVSDPLQVQNENYGLHGRTTSQGHRFFVENIHHEIEPGADHAMNLELSSYEEAGGYWILGVSTLGQDTILGF